MGVALNGKLVAENLRNEIKKKIDAKKTKGEKIPCMANILVGNDGGSLHYVNNQNKLCSTLGIEVKSIYLDENISEEEITRVICDLNQDENINGIILQLPLPKHLDEAKITSLISFEKDIDGLNTISVGKLYKGEKCFIPCTPRGIIELIKSTGEKIEGKNAVVIGRSNIVGKPVAQLLMNENATVTICHSRTYNIKEVCSKADILVAAIGKPGFVTEEFVKENAIVIDVGTTVVNGKLSGDVCFDKVIGKASFLTPVPGGVGAMTTTILVKNLCEGIE